MRQAIALAVLQATPVSSMVPWGERVIPQRNEAFLFKSLFQGIWNLGLLLLGNCRLSESSGHTYSSPEKTWLLLFQGFCMKSISSWLWWNFWETWNVWIVRYMRLMSLNLRLIFIIDTFLVLLRETIQTHSQKSTLLSRFAKQLSCMFIILLW